MFDRTSRRLTMLVLKLEQVQFTTRCCVQKFLDGRCGPYWDAESHLGLHCLPRPACLNAYGGCGFSDTV